MSELTPISLVNFLKSIAVLSWDAEEQIAYIQSVAPAHVDDMILEFDEGWVRLPAFIENGWLFAPFAIAASAIDVQTTDMVKAPNDLFDFSSLREASEWKELRRLARIALVATERR